MNAISRWLDERTGLFTTWDRQLNRRVAGGPTWRYVLPSALVFTFVIEVITGIVMGMLYSPSAQTAWESVFWLQEMVRGGWAIRGLHYFTANVMVVLAALYIVQLLVTRLYRAPREALFWVALLILFALLALMLTGDLLRWDQEGFWSTNVRVNFAKLLPRFGSESFKLVAGGSEFGHLTLSRFYTLHAIVCTAAFAGLLLLQGVLLRRHGLASAARAAACRCYWPGQALLNFLGCGVVLAVIVLLVVQNGFQGEHALQTRGEYLGAPLGAPANPADAYAAARPEWAFLALYKFANIFPGDGMFGSDVSWKVVPIFVVPSALVLLFFLMPFIGRLGTGGHLFNLAVLLFFVGGSIGLGAYTLRHDQHDEEHQKALAAGHVEAQRVKELAKAPQGIPPSGALSLLRNDAKTQGPRLFAQHCASCHHYLSDKDEGIRSGSPSAPNLHGFATRAWVAGFLDPKKIVSDHYFGKTAFKSKDMVGFVKENLSDLDDDEKKQLETAVIALSAEAALVSQREADARDADRIKQGRKLLLEDYGCVDCHRYRDKGQLGKGPDLTGYGSREWLVGIIANPAHKRFYGSRNDRMPVYEELISAQEIELVAQWLRGEWYEPAK